MHILGVLIVLSAPCPAQWALEWSVSEYAGFNNYYDEEPVLLRTQDGGILIKGGRVGFTTGRDIHLLKYDGAGTLVWSLEWNGAFNGNDRAHAMIKSDDGTIYLAGSTQIDTADHDALLLRISAAGVVDWASSYSGVSEGEDQAVALDLDVGGNIYVTGWVCTQPQSAGRVFLMKVDPVGAITWDLLFATPDAQGLTCGRAVSAMGDGCRLVYSHWNTDLNEYRNVLVSPTGQVLSDGGGHCAGGAGASAYAIDVTGSVYMGGKGACGPGIYKSGPNGGLEWFHPITSNLPDNVCCDEFVGIVLDANGDLYATGRHYGDDYNGPTYTNSDILTLKLSPNGSLIWDNRYEFDGTNNGDLGKTLVVSNDGEVIVGGYSQRAGVGSDADYVALLISTIGEELDVMRFDGGSLRDDCVWSVAGDASEMFLTGISMDTLDIASIITQKYTRATGLGQPFSSSAGMSASQNPFSGTVDIRFDGQAPQGSEVHLLDVRGRTIQAWNVSGQSIAMLEAPELSPGIYIATYLIDGLLKSTVRIALMMRP